MPIIIFMAYFQNKINRCLCFIG